MRRPAAGRKDRDKFVSGKTKQNAVKAMVLTDAEGRLLFCSPVRPGSCADRNAPAWYEERHEQQRKAHSSRRIRVEHGIAHLKNWRALARHLGRREHMSDIVQAVAGLLSHQQTATLHRGLRA
ncbi:transposase family protein [Streptomyces sp. NPDC054940]